VVGVHHEVALAELAEGLQEVALAGPGGPAPAGLLSEDLLLAHDDEPQPGQGEAPGDLPLAQDEASLRTPRRAELLEKRRLRVRQGKLVVRKEVAHPQPLLLAGAEVADEEPLAGPGPDPLGHGRQQALLALDEGGLLRPKSQVGLDAEADRPATVPRAELEVLEDDLRAAPGGAQYVAPGEEQDVLLEVELFLVLCPEEEAADIVAGLLLGPCRVQGVDGDDEAVCGQVVRERFEPPRPRLVRVKEREELRVEGGSRSVSDHLGQSVLRPGRKAQLARPDPEVAEGLPAGLLREDQLPGRREGEPDELLARALGDDVHLADRLDLVAGQQQPVGARRRGRVEVDHVAPDAEVARFLDERHPSVPALGELRGEEVPVEVVPDGHGGQEARDDVPRNDFLQQGRPGDEDEGRCLLDERGEDADALPLDVPLRREGVGEHEVPGGHEQDVAVAGEKGRVLRERARLVGAGAQHGHRPSGQRVQGGQEEGLRGALQARDLRLLAAPNAVERVPEAGIGLEERMKFRVHVTKIQYEIPLLPPLKRDRAAMSLRRSEATEAISDILEKVEIAALPSVARNDESRS